MAKFTKDEKLAVVQRYLKGPESYRSIAKAIGTVKAIVMNSVLK